MPSQRITQRRSSGLTSRFRNGGAGGGSLPLTTDDTQKQRKRRRRVATSFYIRWAVIALVATLVLFVLRLSTSYFLGSSSEPSTSVQTGNSNKINNSDAQRRAYLMNRDNTLPLSQFTELSFALENSDLVALYFAAAWCPMSTPVSLALDSVFGDSDEILPTKSTTSNRERKALSIVYISSDETLHEYNNYLHDRNWIGIPFGSPQRRELKLHFSTCALRELQELGIDRKHEIPTIIVIDSKTHGILTTNGVNDVETMGKSALDHWRELQQNIREASRAMLS